MKFKDFLVEQEESGVLVAPDSLPIDEINTKLLDAFDNTIMSAEEGILKVSRIIFDYGIVLPALYGLNPEGDEILFDLDTNLHLYMIYSIDDNGRYDFYAELATDDALEEILKDEEDEV
jgi:hypothetical protein